MKKHKSYRIKKRLLIIMFQLLFVCVLISVALHTDSYGYDKPTVTSQNQYAEVKKQNLTIQWEGPDSSYGTVISYSFLVRGFHLDIYGNLVPDTNLLVNDNNVTTNSYTIYEYLLSYSTKYRMSISAFMSNGTRIWSQEYYFYVYDHDGVSTYYRPITFLMSNSFTALTKQQMNTACNSWKNSLNLGFNVVKLYSTTTGLSSDSYSSGDGVSSITKHNLNNPDILMYTVCVDVAPSHTISEADIIVNTQISWVNSAQPNKYDVQSVLTHEIGHVYGLCDLYDSWADMSHDKLTMYGIAETNSILQRTPEFHDIYYAKKMYQ